MTKLFIPEKIYIEKGAEHYPYAEKIVERFPEIPHEIIGDKKALLDGIRKRPDPIGAGKRMLFLSVDRGQSFKPFPVPEGSVSCNFYSLHLLEGCDLECSYCILQAYLTNPLLTVFVNVEEILDRLDSFLKSHLNQRFRIGTGHLADSLSLDPVTAHTEYLVPFFAKQSNAVLEFKTKSVHIEKLEDLDPAGKTIVSWSINSRRIQKEEEHKCATIEERLAAAKKCLDWGYRIGFHLDPIVDYEGCLEEYEEVIEMIFSTLAPEEITWMSLGTLRFMPRLKSVMGERFPKSPLPYGEWARGLDGKMRYFKLRRIEIYERLVNFLKRRAPRLNLYLCMETEEVWREIFGKEPNRTLITECLDEAGFLHSLLPRGSRL